MMKHITIRQLQRQARLKARVKPTVVNKKSLGAVSKACKEWGDHVAIYADQDTRNHIADSVATRLNLSPGVVRNQMNIFHRMADYDQERNNPAMEE